MRILPRSKRALAAILAGVLAIAGLGFGGGVAMATASGFSTGGDSQQIFLNQDAAWLTPTAAGWHNVPSAATRIFVPANSTRTVHVTFTAESRCLNATRCSVQIVANGGQLLPASGTDFAFDTPGGSYESHPVSRNNRLPGGSSGTWYTIQVQSTIVGPGAGAQFWLDDYTTEVGVAIP